MEAVIGMKVLTTILAVVLFCVAVVVIIFMAWLAHAMLNDMGLIDKIKDLFDSFKHKKDLVYCCYCEHYNKQSGYCYHFNHGVDYAGFCNEGKRKE